MPLKDLLVCIDPTPAGEGRVKLAFNLAATNRAHLAGAYALPEAHMAPAAMARPADAGLNPGGAVSEVFREAEVAETVEHRFKRELQQHGLDGEWHLLTDGDSAALTELAKSVDLTITGQLPPSSHANGAARFRPEDILVAAGRPVLIVPYAGTFATVGKRILVAWDGTREANRALNDALPLLANAEVAVVVFVGSRQKELDQHQPALERIVGHLHRHGIAATTEETLRGDLAVSDILLSRAADLAADLIVSGGYHHSQLREALLGGVSRELLAHMTVPVLMSH
jgi:nucleotide-binding universal stress UspA family protein